MMKPVVSVLWSEESERPSSTAWENWKDEFKLYERVSLRIEGQGRNHFDDEEKRDLFLTFVGSRGRAFLRDLVDDIHDADLEDMITLLNELLDKPVNVHAARHIYRKVTQIPGETYIEFAARLRKEIVPCKFNNIPRGCMEDCMLVQQFLTGILDSEMRLKLMEEDDQVLNIFTSVLDKTKRREQLMKEAAEFKVDKQDSVENTSKKVPRKFKNFKKIAMKQANLCFRCGKIFEGPEHKEFCLANGKTCAKCRAKNHFAKCCWKGRQVSVQVVGENDLEVLTISAEGDNTFPRVKSLTGTFVNVRRYLIAR